MFFTKKKLGKGNRLFTIYNLDKIRVGICKLFEFVDMGKGPPLTMFIR
jgi:hypothetical protein